MKYYLLFDNNRNDKDFVVSKLGLPIIVIYSPETKKKIFGWIRGVLEVVSKSKQKDTIICWYDFQAIICWWVCLLMFKKRNIVCINLLLKDKRTLKNKIVSYLYRRALQSVNFKASVTSKSYGEWLNKKLGINAKYSLVNDVYHDFYKFEKEVVQIPNSVFCGGNNGRDWNLIIKIARSLPNIRFNMVMPHNIYIKYQSMFTKNINVKYNISYDEFMKELCGSSVVCLPLDTQAPAGLIVMFQAAANLKPIITTRTVTTIEYVTPERGVVLPNELEIWVKAILNSLANIRVSEDKAINFRNYLKENCSEITFINKIKEMLF